MRWMLALPLVFSAAACGAQPTDTASRNGAAPARTEFVAVLEEPMTLTAADGVKIFGVYRRAEHPKAIILLFHQAGSSKDEYATIAPRLVQAGYSALAIDQRSGGELYGTNETAKALGREADYLEARPDLQAALDWAHGKKLPIILWGSSYSSALLFPLAAGDPQGIIAVLAFSPGEYFDSDKRMIRRAAAKVTVPVFVASTKEEAGDADPIMTALPKTAGNVRFVPDHGVHGSSTLIARRNPQGAEANWAAVLGFLERVAPGK